MKKTKTKTDELLAKLGASLKESPLTAHARSSETTAIGPSTPIVVDKKAVESKNSKSATVILSNEKLPEPSREISPEEGELLRAEYERGLASSKTVVAAAQVVVRDTRVENREKVEVENQTAKIEDKTEEKERNGKTSVETQALMEKLAAAGVPISPDQMKQFEELQAMRKTIEEIRQTYKPVQFPTPINARPAPMPAHVSQPAPGYAFGSARNTASGWKTSTVGLYPEDYEKAHTVMGYLMQQTGRSVNLSQVVKIALRALEIGPQLLEINTQIRSKDRRMARR